MKSTIIQIMPCDTYPEQTHDQNLYHKQTPSKKNKLLETVASLPILTFFFK